MLANGLFWFPFAVEFLSMLRNQEPIHFPAISIMPAMGLTVVFAAGAGVFWYRDCISTFI